MSQVSFAVGIEDGSDSEENGLVDWGYAVRRVWGVAELGAS